MRRRYHGLGTSEGETKRLPALELSLAPRPPCDPLDTVTNHRCLLSYRVKIG
ncbi:MAG: hypothetical protein JRH11_26010 [Deltaproteobacteria bacterium]|nr:hypothetical protein [Deltaproteobacteria bacterium]